MHIELEKKSNCAYVYLQENVKAGEVKKTLEMSKDLLLDFDKNDKLLGIEILDAAKYLTRQTINAAAKTK